MKKNLNLKRPIVFFDLETTGLDFKYDRIIEIGAIKIYPDLREENYKKRVNPGIRIPAEVTKITGIRNEDVAREAYFKEIVSEVAAFFEKSDLGGYNVARFDAKVMVEEFKRAGEDFRLEERAIVDAQIIFHQKERRDLTAAYKFYCGKDLTAAHSAFADIKATHEILLAQLNHYGDLPNTVQDLYQFCRADKDRFVDSEGKFFWRDGEAVFNFGKFKSKSLRSVAKANPEYLQWVISPKQNFSQDTIDICYRALQGEFPQKGAGPPDS